MLRIFLVSIFLCSFAATAESISEAEIQSKAAHQTERKAIESLIESFRISIIKKDKDAFTQLFYDTDIAWLGVFSQSSFESIQQGNPKANKVSSDTYSNFIDWTVSQDQIIEEKLKQVNELPGHKAHTSIYFGGLRVIGGNDNALKWLLKELPKTQEFYPFRLPGNAAFHTPLLEQTSHKAKKELPPKLFDTPKIPMIDGRGKIWMPYSTEVNELWEYTLGHQVYETYDFTKAIEVAIKEFAPDHLIIIGPGMTLGGAVAQALIKNNYKITNKEEFKTLQSESPYMLAMGDAKQRSLCIKPRRS